MPKRILVLNLALSLLTANLTLSLPPAMAQSGQTDQSSQSGPQRLVVLPFKNLSRMVEDDWLGESFSENLTMALSQSQHVELVERSQLDMVMREQGLGQSAFADEASAPRLGRLIGAGQLLLGSYQKQGNRLLVNARLVDVETGRVLSGKTVQLEGDYERLFTLQSQLAGQVLAQMGTAAPAMRQLEHSLKICASTGAYEQYRHGMLLARMMSDPRLRDAIGYFEKAVAQDPEFTLAYVALSEALSLRAAQPYFYPSARPDDLTRALDYAERALENKNHPEAVYRALARAYAARKQPEQALAAISESLRQKPGDTDSVLVYLDLHAQRAVDLDQLQQDLVRFKADTDDPWIQFSLAMVYLKYHKQRAHTDLVATRKLLLEVRRKLPTYTFVQIKLAWLETLEQRYDSAFQMLEEALRIEPDNYMFFFKAGLLMTAVPAYQAQAESWLKKSIALLPDFGLAESQLGALYFRQNKLEEARHYLLLARQHLPAGAMSLTYLGLLAERQGQDSQAYAYLTQALENAGTVPNEPFERGRLHLYLARLDQKMKRLPAAESHARLALNEVDIHPAEAYYQLIALPMARQDYTAALQLFQEYQTRAGGQLSEADQRLYQQIYLQQQLQVRPNDPALLNDLGGLALVDGQITEADGFLSRAQQLSPDSVAILFNLGLLRLQQQRYAEAITILRQVQSKDPSHRKAAFNLGRAQLASGDKAGARQTWNDLLRSFPGDSEALQELEKL